MGPMVAPGGGTGNRTLVLPQRQLSGRTGRRSPGTTPRATRTRRPGAAGRGAGGRSRVARASHAASSGDGLAGRRAQTRPDEPGSGPGDPLRRDVAGHGGRVLASRARWLSLPDDDDDAAVRRPEHDQPAARGPRPATRSGVRRRRSRTRPTGSCTRSTWPWRSANTTAFVELLASLGPDRPRARQRPREPGPRLPVRSVAGHGPRRDPAATRQAQPAVGAGRHRSLDARRRHRDAGPDRGARARSRAATRSGSGRTSCASAGRCGRTPTVRGSSPSLVGGDVRVFDVPYWRGPAELIHLLSVISPIADDLAVVYLPLLPVGPVAAPPATSGSACSRSPTRSSRRSGCNVLAVRPGVVIAGRGQSGDRAGHGRGRLRGPHVCRDRDRRQRLRRPDLPDPPDPARLTVSRRPLGCAARRW